MASIKCLCEDCKISFEQKYFFLRPVKIKCPSCGSSRVREEDREGHGCGCSGQQRQERPYRYT